MTELQFIKCIRCKGRKLVTDFSIKKSTGSRLKKCDLCRAKVKLNKPIAKEQCPRCPQKCTSPALLKTHIKIHDDIRDFVCSICSSKFIQKRHLEDHIKSHDRGFGCSRCEQKFSTRSSLKVHIKAHGDFSCPSCNRTFAQKGDLNTHIKAAHDQIREHSCPMCLHTSILKKHMKVHMKTCTGGSRMSSGEFAVKGVLDTMNILFQREKRFEDCRNKVTLPFDFYLPNHNAIIEFDGEEHFGPITYFGGQEKFEQRQKNDAIKNAYCVEKKIQLLRIKHTDIKLTPNLITNFLSSIVETSQTAPNTIHEVNSVTDTIALISLESSVS